MKNRLSQPALATRLEELAKIRAESVGCNETMIGDLASTNRLFLRLTNRSFLVNQQENSWSTLWY